MRSSHKKYTEKNRAAWNEVIPKHKKAWGDSIRANLSRPDFVYFDVQEVKKLKEYGIKGKKVAHICCNNGIETLSLKKLGAASCVGFDISDAAIAEAVILSKSIQIPATFIRTDVYDIPSEFNDEFTFIFISGGTLGWMPDLKRFFRKICGLLKENGIIFIHEVHPFIDIFDENKMKIKYSYFKDTPFVDYDSLDYVGKTKYKSKPKYWFSHTMSEIIQELINNGICIQFFEEYAEDISAVSDHLVSKDKTLPLSYMLIGNRQKK